MTTPEIPNSRLYAAWFENLAVAEDHPDRVYFIVEATLRIAQMSAHHEVEESGPEVGLPAKRVMTSPVQAYVREDVAEAAVAYDRGPLLVTIRDQGNKIEALDAETTALRRDLDSLQGQANMHIEGLFNQSATIETLKTETTALRRERDALRLHLAAVLGCFEENEAGVLPEHAAVFIEAKCALVRAETTASAAGKGVG